MKPTETNLLDWIAFNDARTTDAEELACTGTVRMAAEILGRTPRWVAVEVSRIVTRANAWRPARSIR